LLRVFEDDARMTDIVLDIQRLSKKFRRGQIYNTLRDFLPALTGNIFRPAGEGNLDQRDFWALKDVSFSVSRGEAFGIIGGNGAGKSTILKLLTGIMKPTQGIIDVHGRISALIEVSAGFHQDLTGRENIYLNGAILGMSREEIHKRFDAIVDFSGLEEFIDTPVKRYSSGMFARLGFSVAAHVDPDVLLVDEVLSVGDYLFQQKCLDRMQSVICSGATVVFVSHNLREVARLCRRSLLLERGQVQMIGATQEVINAYYHRGQEYRTSNLKSRGKDAVIIKVVVHDGIHPRMEFQSGERLFVSVEAQAHGQCDDMSIVIAIVDDHQYLVFDTCTQRLNARPITLREGQTVTCTFEMIAQLVEGTFHVHAYLHRYVTDLPYDSWRSAANFFVKATPEARGVAMLSPRLVECVVAAGNANCKPTGNLVDSGFVVAE
jgi:lipopolysaccharide transport system ATP-binding protein